ncbi:ATP-binding protein [Candidatus Margulisiibacteriota bacterium]
MFDRNITKYLISWKERPARKPLIIRGARQVGKTVAVELFAEEFQSFVSLNLDRNDHLQLFHNTNNVQELIQAIQLKTNIRIIPGSTLLFIDEIQNSPEAIKLLRFFYEDFPDLHVVAAGSLLEVKMAKEGFSFPVGRVEYCYMYPVSFNEYLQAMGEAEALHYLSTCTANTSIPPNIHNMLMQKFHEYIFVGGMPEAVKAFAENRDYLELNNIYESILTSYYDDIHKYATKAEVPYIQHCFDKAPFYAGQRMKYEGFGESNYRSREMKNALTLLEKAMIIHSVLPAPSLRLPILPNLKKAGKLLFLDVGLMNYRLGLREQLHTFSALDDLYRGFIAEQIVGQSILVSGEVNQHRQVHYWYRDKQGSSAEVDFVIPFKDTVIPIEVKSGKAGKLRSLHQFMAKADHDIGVRIYSGPLKLEVQKTQDNRSYKLLSLPFYLIERLKAVLNTLS